ncbi:MAG: sigma 54-interacting transcriptional regulator [Deltaproteobacteria bacterium]|nr:sigma 54-interacting transcriptional regulator [Deltaproteobacteria bacterium]
MEIIPDGVVMIEPSGRIIYANSSAVKLLELPAEELIDSPTEKINPLGWSEISRIFEDGVPQIGARSSVKGKLFITSRLPLNIEGRIVAVISFFQGIFSYDQYALELESYKQTAKLLQAIMDFSFDGLWITDRQGNVVKLNKAAERITGCKAEEVLGRNVADLVQEGYVDESVTLEVLKRKTTVSLVQNTKLKKKVLATGSPIFGSDGEIDVIIINDRDITELDRIRQELNDSKALIDQYRLELSELQQKEFESGYFLCKSKVMQTVYAKAQQVARFDSTVLLSGESGVGKGLLAKLIHLKSNRSKGPFIRVDCAAVVETLFESELFGYEKGAFTGAGPKGKLGLIEMADGGTLFLDEISEVPLSQQVKLLRFLDEKSFFRVGGATPRTVDTRVIAATNKDLAQEVREHRFRKDLFYRLKVVALEIPPLQGRSEDILDLIHFFMAKFSEKHRIKRRMDREVLDLLVHFKFPGNVRELENLVESLMVTSPQENISLRDVPADLLQEINPSLRNLLPDPAAPSLLPQYIQNLEVEHILKVVGQYGSQREAARHLGVNQSTISRKLRKLGNR